VKLPRDLDGLKLAVLLRRLGYSVVRQTGSHIRLTAIVQGAEVHVTVPAHSPLKVGMLSGILNEVALQQQIPRREVEEKLFR